MQGNRDFANSAAGVVLLAYLYVFLEWLFLATKPSFLSTWDGWHEFLALAIGALPFVGVALLAHAACCGLSILVDHGRQGNALAMRLPRVVPALVVVATTLMLVDNFTYTMFGWGVVKTGHATAPVYWVCAAALFAWLVRRNGQGTRARTITAAALVAVSCTTLAWGALGTRLFLQSQFHSAREQLPNIVMFASDGVNADHMSAYGYARRTTPNLDRYMADAMVMDNAFTNSGWTTGSLTSMLTGKYPATTKVMYPPYTLQGRDAYQSLPRILHLLGYTSLQETVRYYADGPDLNWKDSFDYANGRKVDNGGLGKDHPGLQRPLQFATHLYHRLGERVRQLLFIQRMPDRHAAVTSRAWAKVYGVSDATRMQRVVDFIDHAHQPFFIHIHLMGTHCCTFHPDRKVFSAQSFATKAERDTAAFDDTILESDGYFQQLMDALERKQLLGNTLVVYSSDHDKGWTFNTQVPLIFLFPHGAHRGHVTAPTQLLDVAPTVLDYLEVPVPAWMEGRSLLRPDLAPYYPVYNVYRLQREHFETGAGDQLARIVHVGPPTYGLGQAGLVVCQRWFVLRLANGEVRSGTNGKYQGACPNDKLPDDDEARKMISQHLHERGFSF